MRTIIAYLAAKCYSPCKTMVLLCLLCSLMLSACTPDSTPVPTLAPISLPTIVPARACNLEPGETIPLVAMGIPGSDVVYTWSASTGMIVPPNSPTVNYTAPETAGDVIIKVVAQKGEQTSEGMIACKIVAVPTATLTETPVPTPTETPVPTATTTPTPTPPQCPGSSSEELIKGAWVFLGNNDFEMVLACTQAVIDSWSSDADQQQQERVTNGTCKTAPNAKNTTAVNTFLGRYWALNDVATAWYLRREAFKKSDRQEEADKAYQTLKEKYSCGYAWDPAGPALWNVADAAK